MALRAVLGKLKQNASSLLSPPLLFSQIGTCEVKNGFPKPNITWYWNSTPLQLSSDGEWMPGIQSHPQCLFLLPFPFLPFSETWTFFSLIIPKVDITPTITFESSGLFSVTSELKMTVTKEVNNDFFYCEVSYLVPGETRMMESDKINVTVLCEFRSTVVMLSSECRKRVKHPNFVFSCEKKSVLHMWR